MACRYITANKEVYFVITLALVVPVRGDERFLCRMDDGIPSLDKDRLKCLGNSIVPRIAEYLWELIKE